MSPLPTVLALQDTWVHIGTFNGSDEMSNVEVTIDDVLCQRTALGIPDVVVATTRHSRTNDLTMSKALQWAIK